MNGETMKHYVRSVAQILVLIAYVLLLSVTSHVTAQEPRSDKPARDPQRAGASVQFASGSSALKIPLELDGTAILLQVSVNHSKPLKFVLDAAASISIISPQRAAELGLKTRGQVRGTGTGGNIQASLIDGVSLSVPGAEVSNQLIAAVSFDTVPCFEFDGIIGYDFINQFVVEIDYQNRVMNLYDPRVYVYSGKGEIVAITISPSQRTPLVRTKLILEGRAPVEANLEIDTGGDGAVLINSPFVAKQKLLAAVPKTLPSSAFGGGGEQKLLFGRVKAVQLGQLIIENPVAGFSQDTEGSGASEENDGFIGGEILHRFKVILDYSRKQMILEPNKSLGDPYEVDMSGITVGSGKDDCKVMRVESVVKDSPASEAGLQAGDIITAIDGKPTSSFPSTENGKELTLTVKRGEGLIQKKIKLRRLV
jgi:Aspartyl protease/PDZ domain